METAQYISLCADFQDPESNDAELIRTNALDAVTSACILCEQAQKIFDNELIKQHTGLFIKKYQCTACSITLQNDSYLSRKFCKLCGPLHCIYCNMFLKNKTALERTVCDQCAVCNKDCAVIEQSNCIVCNTFMTGVSSQDKTNLCEKCIADYLLVD